MLAINNGKKYHNWYTFRLQKQIRQRRTFLQTNVIKSNMNTLIERTY